MTWAALALLATMAGGGDSVLYDARDQTALSPGITIGPKLPAAESKAVLAVLSRAKGEPCPESGGRVYDEISAKATGAFTAPGVVETAYVVQSHSCEDLGIPGDTHLLIFRGPTPVARASGPGMVEPGPPPAFAGREIRRLVDVDGDGVSELLVTGSGFGQGVLEQSARLYSAKGGKVRRLHEAYGVYVDSCATDRDRRVEAQVLRLDRPAKGGPPRITSQTYVAPCPRGGLAKPSDFKPVPR
jgi:hypothetical protein